MSIYLETAKKQIEKGIVGLDVIKSNLAKHYLELDKQEFEDKLRAEYDELYPMFKYLEDVVTDVKDAYIQDGWVVYNEFIADNYVKKYSLQKKIDYSQDENYVTFEEYKNEMRVVSEAVEATYDEGMELFPYIPEVAELVRPYKAKDVSGLVDEYLQPILNTKVKEEAQEYLNSTDWIIAKIVEYQVKGLDVAPLTDKYSDELVKRDEVRSKL